MSRKYINNKSKLLLLSLFIGGISFSRGYEVDKLNQIYDSIISAGEIGGIHETIFAPKEELVILLDQIYTNSPYSYSILASKETLRFFEDNLTLLTVMPKKYDLAVQFKMAYPNYRGMDTMLYSNGGKIGEKDLKNRSSSTGGLLTLEYGLTNNSSLGLVVGGSNQDINFSNKNSLDMKNGYAGMFGRVRFGNLKFIAGGGYQTSEVKANRNIENGVRSYNFNSEYKINSYNGFLEGRYNIPFNKSFSIEPKIRGSYYGITQDNINEGYKQSSLRMNVYEQKVNLFDIRTGVDLLFENTNSTGKITNIFSLEGIATTGDKTKNLKAYMLGLNNTKGSIFDIKYSKMKDFTGRIGYSFEIEQCSGMLYNFKSNVELGDNGYTNYNFLIGVGYKFATYKDFIAKQEVIPEPEVIVEPEPVVETISDKVVKVKDVIFREFKKYILDLTFASDKSTLSYNDKEEVGRVAKEIIERNNSVYVSIVGYTDNIGTAKYNLELSERRAETAKIYLESLLNTKELQGKVVIESYGRGEDDPIATNKTKEGRAKNRRVEIRIFE